MGFKIVLYGLLRFKLLKKKLSSVCVLGESLSSSEYGGYFREGQKTISRMEIGTKIYSSSKKSDDT